MEQLQPTNINKNRYQHMYTITPEQNGPPPHPTPPRLTYRLTKVAAGFYHTVCIISESGVKRRARPLNSDLYGLLGNPSQSDVTFLVEGKAIYGHRLGVSLALDQVQRCT